MYNGSITRAQGEPRIQYLARLRNAALQPLYDSALNSSATRPDKVIFINDVLFCANDVLRLVAQDADMICGLDLYQAPGKDTWQFYGESRCTLIAQASPPCQL